MEDELFLSLTREVKEEVVQNYLTERRLIELQTEELKAHAQETLAGAQDTGKRITRLSYLMMLSSDTAEPILSLLHISAPSFWNECLFKTFSRNVRFIRVGALTRKAKYRKLLAEAYRRLYLWMEKYRKDYEDLEGDCRGVNENIKAFQQRFDLLTILNFLKSLDVIALERKHFLGENFTAQELSSIDQTLYIRPVSFENFQLPSPLPLPKPDFVEDRLSELADEIYRKHETQARRLMK